MFSPPNSYCSAVLQKLGDLIGQTDFFFFFVFEHITINKKQ